MKTTTFAQYEVAARRTAKYAGRDTHAGITYNALKLAGEAGEIADLVGKMLGRTGSPKPTGANAEHIEKELGDVLWHLTMLCSELGYTLDEIAEANLAKLRERARAGTLLERPREAS